MYAVASCDCAARRAAARSAALACAVAAAFVTFSLTLPHKSGTQLANSVARNALPIWPDCPAAPAPELRETPARDRSADAFKSIVGKKAARATATAAVALRKAASAAARFWFEMSTCFSSELSTGSSNTDHHAPRSIASAGRASRQPASHLYDAGTGAVGRTYSGPTVQAVNTRQTVNPKPRTIRTRAVGPRNLCRVERDHPGPRPIEISVSSG